ncbi:glycosyl transferase [Methylomonas sp. ZR1]|uniref:glycosyl transferase n=1 Tax=Methylomonas sp. ZR1 TaxID=1797072 RepID=UPI001491AB64|nr:glycosyl transferase [Methylomonas sp. ZR1]NOV29884.1 glycosyl transferase [Methylomonas sp. ZR1]
MNEHYVTLFDSLFLPQGLALYASMQRHAGAYTLWILCMDDEVFEKLGRLDLPNVRLLQLSILETDELINVKRQRTIAEYCWTLTPFTPRFVFASDPSVQRVTYLDADLWFRKNPKQIFWEFEESGKQLLITDHAYAPEYDRSATSGQYCVQFMIFQREGGEEVRRWWEARCLEWCHARAEDGKFGDQKYLDDWTERFSEQVHVLADKELLQAPWNATRFPHGRAVCWHFHELRILKGLSAARYTVDCGSYPLPSVTRRHIYREYLIDLRRAIDTIKTFGWEVKAQRKLTLSDKFFGFFLGFWRQVWRTTIHWQQSL